MGDGLQPVGPEALPALLIDGTSYFNAAHIARLLGVSRQTLWRWRREGKVPAGQVYRDRTVLYTRAEADQVRVYAHRLKPADVGPTNGGPRRPGATGERRIG